MSAVIVASFMGKEITITRNITEEDCVAPVKKPRKTRSDKGKTNKKCCSCERTERQLEKGEDGKGTYALFFNAETKQTLITSYAQGFAELVCYECDMNSKEVECDTCEKYYYTKGIYSEEEYEAFCDRGYEGEFDETAHNSCKCEAHLRRLPMEQKYTEAKVATEKGVFDLLKKYECSNCGHKFADEEDWSGNCDEHSCSYCECDCEDCVA